MDIPSHIAFDQFGGRTVHLGVSGSIAAYKSLELLRMLTESSLMVTVSLTGGGARFVTPLAFQALGAQVVDTHLFNENADSYAHLRPGMEADAFIIAPATANILAKAAHGLADDILSCQALSWPGSIIFAPAMNTRMLESQATQANIAVLRDRGHLVLGSASGTLACGETGSGRLADVRDLYLAVLRQLAPKDLEGKKVLVTLGRTEEAWDSVRRWTNPSSGRMGAAIAIAAWLRGAEVHAVCGPCDLYLPASIYRHDITTAQELYHTCTDLWSGMDLGCCVAAVCDFRPEPFTDGKFKKSDAPKEFTLAFHSNPDTLAALGAAKSPHQRLIGFAAETSSLEKHLADKMERKNTDLMVGNLIGSKDTGFQSDSNKVIVLDRNGRMETWPLLAKTEIGWRIWDWLVTL